MSDAGAATLEANRTRETYGEVVQFRCPDELVGDLREVIDAWNLRALRDGERPINRSDLCRQLMTKEVSRLKKMLRAELAELAEGGA